MTVIAHHYGRIDGNHVAMVDFRSSADNISLLEYYFALVIVCNKYNRNVAMTVNFPYDKVAHKNCSMLTNNIDRSTDKLMYDELSL
jgi:hypothetical protein